MRQPKPGESFWVERIGGPTRLVQRAEDFHPLVEPGRGLVPVAFKHTVRAADGTRWKLTPVPPVDGIRWIGVEVDETGKAVAPA